MGTAAAAFPGAAASFDLDHVELRVVDRPPDRRTDLAAARTTEAGEAVLIANDARDHEVHATTGVGHPLHHVDVEDLVLGLREEDVHDFRLADRQARSDRVPERRELAREDPPPELCLWGPLAQVPLRPRGPRPPPPAPAAPTPRHHRASSFVFTASNWGWIDFPMW